MQHSARARRCGWRWKVASGVVEPSSKASIFTKRVPEVTMCTTPKPIHSKRRPTYALDQSAHKRNVQKRVVAVAMRAYAEMQRHLENNGLRHLQLQTATRNTVRNPTIRLDHVPPYVRAVAHQTGGRCHGHRSPFSVGCRSRTVLHSMVMNASWNVFDISSEECQSEQ